MAPPLITSMDLPRYPADVAAEAAEDATGLVRGYAGWHIAPTITEEVVLDGRGGCYLSVPTLHLLDVTAATVDGDDVLSELTWSSIGRVWRNGVAWTSGYGTVALTIVHGHPTTPSDVKAVTRAVARRIIANPELLRQEAVAGYSATFDGELVGPERHRLARYRLPGRP